MERIKKLLLSKNIRPSHHRIKVLQYLEQTHSHPTVEEIHQEVKHMIPTISKATIYNTLKVFQEAGLVTAIPLSGEETRYDFKRKPHAHFHCNRCGKVTDIKTDFPCLSMNSIGAIKLSEIKLVFKGTCEKCQKEIAELNL